jgi:hypothetical protein
MKSSISRSAPASITITPVRVADLLADGELRVRALDPQLVWLAQEHEPWRPSGRSPEVGSAAG